MAVTKQPNGKWQATYRGGDGRERQRTLPTKLDAERWEREQRADVGRGTWIDPSAGRETFGNYARRWQSMQVHHRANTARRVAATIDQHLAPLHHRPLVSLRRADMTAFVADLSSRLAPGTVRMIVKVLRAVLSSAVEDGALMQSPARRLALPELHREPVVPLDVDQVARLADTITPRYRALVLTGAGCGLRLGELLGLGVGHVAFLERSVRVDRQLLDNPPRFGPPKTRNAVRTVPAPTFALDALSAHLAQFGPGPDDLVFTSPRGGPVKRSGLGHAWKRAVELAELPAGTSPHGLRHHYASVLIDGGESPVAVAARLGDSVQMVTDVYAHLMPDTEARTRQVVEAAWARGLSADLAAPVGR
jgi:integrase